MPNRTLVLRPQQVCSELAISISTLWRLVKSGRIRTIKISPRCTGVLRTDLDIYLDSLK